MCWVPYRVRAIGDKVVFPEVAGHKPATSNPASWCSRATAELLVERFPGRDLRRDGALVIGATIPGEVIGTTGTVRIGRIAIADGWSGSPGVELYSEQAIRIAETLGTATERHCDSTEVSLLFGYPIDDTDDMRTLETAPGTRLVLSELWTDRTYPVSPNEELSELRLIDSAALAAAIGAPPTVPASPTQVNSGEPQPSRRRRQAAPRNPAPEPVAEALEAASETPAPAQSNAPPAAAAAETDPAAAFDQVLDYWLERLLDGVDEPTLELRRPPDYHDLRNLLQVQVALVEAAAEDARYNKAFELAFTQATRETGYCPPGYELEDEAPQPAPAGNGTAADVDLEAVAEAIYTAHARAAVGDNRGSRPWGTVSEETRAWVLKQARAAVTATLAQLQR
jgi:hypothetical protein